MSLVLSLLLQSTIITSIPSLNIDKSERNRPSYLEENNNLTGTEIGMEIMSTMLRQGKQPSEIAEIVFKAIQSNIFYILSHPAWDETLRSHYENILSRKEISRTFEEDVMKFFKPRNDGEKY